jgi:hypothetical protein
MEILPKGKTKVKNNSEQALAKITGKISALDYSNFFIVVVFSKSTSQVFDSAIFLAQGADWYCEKTGANNELFYIAGFFNNVNSVAKASMLVRYCSGWNSTIYFVNGKPRHRKIRLFLECYNEALNCDNPRAHCYASVGVAQNNESVVVPCKLGKIGLFDKDLPASFEEQLQADSVEMGCDLCPLFKSDITRPKTLKNPSGPKYW